MKKVRKEEEVEERAWRGEEEEKKEAEEELEGRRERGIVKEEDSRGVMSKEETA